MRPKKWTVFLAVAALAIGAAGCGGGGKSDSSSSSGNASPSPSAQPSQPPQNVTLRVAWWGGQPRHDYTLKVIEMYQQQNPHVKIEPEYASFDDYWKRLAPQAAANELPDILQMDLMYIVQYGEKGQLEDLTPYLGSIIKTDDISENVINGGKVGGKLYGFNLGVNTLQVHYDPELLKQAGVTLDQNWTWDDYERIALEVKQKTGLYFDTSLRPEVFFGYFLRTKGKTLYSADGTSLGYDDDALFVEYFGRTARLAKAGASPLPDVTAQIKGLEDDLMVKKQAVSVWQWTNQFVGISKVANRPLEMHPLPGPNREKGLYLKPSMFFSISKNSKHKEEAAKFINFFVNDIEANKLIKGDRGVPVSAKVKEALKPVLSPAEAKVFDFVAWAEKNSSPMDPPDPIGAAEVANLLKTYDEQLKFNKITPEEAARKFREQANAVLAKNKK